MPDELRFSDDYHVLQREQVGKISGGFAHTGPLVSVVPQMQDFAADPALCLTAVAFPSAALGNIVSSRLIEPLRKHDPTHYFYPTRSLHVTIKNIRSIADPANFGSQQIATADRVLSAVVPTLPRFSFRLQEVIALQNSIAVVGYSNRNFGELVLGLDSALRSAGIADDKRYISDTVFFGTMTICRFRGDPADNLPERLAQLSVNLDEEFQVSRIQLLVCNAVCSSATRRIVASYVLK